jgi:hypothetical protein
VFFFLRIELMNGLLTLPPGARSNEVRLKRRLDCRLFFHLLPLKTLFMHGRNKTEGSARPDQPGKPWLEYEITPYSGNGEGQVEGGEHLGLEGRPAGGDAA